MDTTIIARSSTRGTSQRRFFSICLSVACTFLPDHKGAHRKEEGTRGLWNVCWIGWMASKNTVPLLLFSWMPTMELVWRSMLADIVLTTVSA